MRLKAWAATACLIAATTAGVESRESGVEAVVESAQRQQRTGREETERFSRRVRLGQTGSFIVTNVSGDIAVSGGSGEDVVIEAVKRTSGDRAELDDVAIEVDEAAGRVEIRTRYEGRARQRRGDRVSVDFTVAVPAGATVEVRSVSGNARVANVTGAIRAESVSGDISTVGSPRVEVAKSVSGDVEVSGATAEGDLRAASVSGNVRANGVRARTLELSTVSGDMIVTDGACDRLEVKSVIGDIAFSGTLVRSGRYEINSHSGDVRLTLAGHTGFELMANSFSGDIRSDWPVTLGGASRDGRRTSRSRQTVRGTYGDGSAVLDIRTFSGDIAILKR
jgi:DUF4097 and DUF4098 domain-containing protein YvlB